MRTQLIEIKQANSVFEAHTIRSFLESHDIPCFIADEHLINMNWAYKHALGDIRIRVLKADQTKALELLDIQASTAKRPSPAPRPPLFRSILAFCVTIISGIPTPLRKKRNEKR